MRAFTASITALASFAFLGIATVNDAQATPVTWNFNCTSGCSSVDGPDGNTRSFLGSDGVTSVTAKAWGLTGGSSNTYFQTAFLGHYSGGLGVTNREESGSSSSHTLDNASQKDVIGFFFSDTITITSAFLSAFGDTDISVWVGTVGAMPDLTDSSLNNFTKLDTAFGTHINNTGGTSSRTADLTGTTLVGNFLLIAARIDDSSDLDDKIKIKSLTGEPFDPPPSSDVVEPASLALFGLGAFGIAALRRRRKAA